MAKKNILEEAIADGKSLRRAAVANATNVLMEGLKSNLKEMVEDQINEMADEEGGEAAPDADLDLSELEGGDEGEDEMALDDLNLSESADEGSESAEEEAAEEEGLTEADLHEAIAAALQEVDHAGLGDMDEIDPDSHPTGLMDQDKKEAGWEEKTAPSKKDFTVKEAAYKKRIGSLVSENTMLKKANESLKKTISEVNLFNVKLNYAHKFVNRQGLDENRKRAIIAKLDEATTVSEVKRLAEALETALGTVSGKSARKGKPLSEALGITQKGDGPNVSKVESPVLTEDSAFSKERFQRVAGIIKD